MKRQSEKAKKNITDFKKIADTVQVDLNQIIIKSNNWQEEVVINNSKSGGYNQLGGRGDLNIETVQHNLNVIQLSLPYRGRLIEVNYRIDMNLTVLKMKLAIQEVTTLYINPNNTDELYLDMEFLES